VLAALQGQPQARVLVKALREQLQELALPQQLAARLVHRRGQDSRALLPDMFLLLDYKPEQLGLLELPGSLQAIQ
jgi:hypothetical protein